MIKVSVIIPVWNQEKLLRKAVKSLPLDENIEVIIVDDGSTDRSWEVAQELSAHPKIRCFHLEENCGVSTARNLGIDKAQGEYLYMLDSDDWVYTENFREVMKMLDGFDLIYFNLKGNKGRTVVLTPNNKNITVGQVKFMRREFVGDTRYPIEKRVAEDWNFQFDLQAKNPIEKFTHILVLHYNYPRVGSLSYMREKELKKKKKT